MKKILVTGATGFIGKALTQELENQKMSIIKVSSQDGDIADSITLEKYKDEAVAHVIHLAAKTFVPDSWKNPKDFYEANFNGTLNVLDFCREKRAGLTYISTYVYGQPERNPIKEEDRISSNNPYGHSKYLAEQLCEFYAQQFDVNIKIIRPFNVYGIGQKDNFLIPHIIKQAMEEENIEVMDLNPKRDYIYIKDLVQAIILTIKSVDKFGIYNIGYGKSYSVAEIIEKVQNILGTNKLVISKKSIRKNEINDVIADINKAKEKLGWQPKYTIEEGLKEIIECGREK